MKMFAVIALLMISSFSAVKVFAFPPTIALNAGVFKARQACPDLRIAANDNVDTLADYTHLMVIKWTPGSNAKSSEKAVLKFSVPDQGAYVFRGVAGQQQAREFLSHGFTGDNIYRLKLDNLGNLIISHYGPNPTTECFLTNNSGGG